MALLLPWWCNTYLSKLQKGDKPNWKMYLSKLHKGISTNWKYVFTEINICSKCTSLFVQNVHLYLFKITKISKRQVLVILMSGLPSPAAVRYVVSLRFALSGALVGLKWPSFYHQQPLPTTLLARLLLSSRSRELSYI